MATNILSNLPDSSTLRRALQAASSNLGPKLSAAAVVPQRLASGAGDWYDGASSRAALGFASTAAPGALNNLKIGAGGIGALYGLVSLPGAYSTAFHDLRDAVRNGDWSPAVESSSRALKTTLTTAQGSLALAAKVAERLRYPGIEKAALKAVEDVVGAAHFGGLQLDKAATEAISKLVAGKAMIGESVRDVELLGELAKAQKGAVGGAWIGAKLTGANALRSLGIEGAAESLERGVAKQGERAAAAFLKEGGVAAEAVEGALMASPSAVLKAAGKAGTEAAEVAARAGTKAAVEAGAEVAAKAGAEALAKTGATTLAKVAGRFAPGVNIAIAGLDIANCAAAWTDSHASIAKKVTSTVTALGSVVAATDIPIVSQIGAAVSIGSTVVGAALDNAGAIKHVAQEVGHAVSNAAQEVGHAVKSVGEKVGNAVKDVGHKLKSFFHL